MLLVGLAACGPTMPDNSTGRVVGATANIASMTAAAVGGNAESETKPGAAADNKADAKADAEPYKPNGRNREVPGVPEPVLKDLASQDPYSRLRALDHWTTKSTTASFDPVFEAMEDQDQAVRARATAIVEQQWAIEQEKEKR